MKFEGSLEIRELLGSTSDWQRLRPTCAPAITRNALGSYSASASSKD